MELINNLDELKIGDWVKVFQSKLEKYPFKIGEIIHKWKQKGKLNFELKILRTNLPITTEKMISKFLKDHKDFMDYFNKKNAFSDKKVVFKLDEKEKNRLLKEIILEELK